MGSDVTLCFTNSVGRACLASNSAFVVASYFAINAQNRSDSHPLCLRGILSNSGSFSALLRWYSPSMRGRHVEAGSGSAATVAAVMALYFAIPSDRASLDSASSDWIVAPYCSVTGGRAPPAALAAAVSSALVVPCALDQEGQLHP